MATATNDPDEIRLRMAQIRRDLHADVRDVVASAEAATDWRRYIRMYPWAALGVTVAVGYLLVPRRHPRVEAAANAAEVHEVIERAKETAKDQEKEPQRKGLLAMGLGFLTPIALRAAQGYAVQYLESWIAQQQQAMGMGPSPASSPSSASPTPGQPDRSGGAGRPQTKPPF